MANPDETEIETLNGYLDAYRGAIRWKVEGLTLEQATKRLLPSDTSLLGIVKHMAGVERFWFQVILGERDVDMPYSKDDPDADFHIEADETIESLVALFDDECRISREILATKELTDMMPLRDGEVMVRDVVIHMIEETARHAGHMDILRELIDGSTGGFPPEGTPWS